MRDQSAPSFTVATASVERAVQEEERMAGISTSASKSGRKSVDQEVSMVPFIDL